MKRLDDGEFRCNATLLIKDGKALVILDDSFELPEGTRIPLLRSEGFLEVLYREIIPGAPKNGHTII
jgi:hypothetical protein